MNARIVSVIPKTRIIATVSKQGPQGSPGTGGGSGGASFSYVQSLASNVWGPITHGLGRNPVAITVYDATGDQVIGAQPTFIDSNRVTLTFGFAFAGTALFK